MVFDPTRFALNQLVLVGQGVDAPDALRLAAPLSMIKMPLAQSVVFATAIGQREAPSVSTPTQPSTIVRVPPLADGADLEDATTALTRADLVPHFALGRVGGDQEPWTVDQVTVPPAGTEVANGSSVVVTVRVLTPVPDVTGMTYAVAQMALAPKGLGWKLEKADADVAPDVVAYQCPPAGSGEDVPVGTIVTLGVKWSDALEELTKPSPSDD